MRNKLFIALALVLVAGLAGAVGVYAYDSSRDDLIARGVTVAGIDLGGMRAGEARSVLSRELGEPLARPITVKVRGRRFTLSAERARVTADIEGMVQEALSRSRDGNVITRTVRGITGGEVDAALEPRVTWSREAVARLVRRVKRRVDRKPSDASVSPSLSGLQVVRHRDGLAVRGKELERRVNAEIANAASDRTVTARTKVVKPDVTTDELADRHPIYLVVNRSRFQLRVYKRLELAKTYRIAVGKVGLETPAGLYHIQNKAVDPAWHVPNSDWAGDLAGKVIPPGPENPIKARWMGIYNGAGIHGTDAVGSLGTAASHGCIRMAIPDVKELYDQVPVQTPVYIG